MPRKSAVVDYIPYDEFWSMWGIILKSGGSLFPERYVKDRDPNRVWSVCMGSTRSDELIAHPGLHAVNANGYIITRRPWDDPKRCAIYQRAKGAKPEWVVCVYQYRDAANFKAGGLILLQGQSSNVIECEIRNCCESDLYFVAEQVGLPPLYEELYSFSNGPTVDDHAYHEFHGLRIATDAEVASLAVWGTVLELIKRFRRERGAWDCRLTPHCF